MKLETEWNTSRHYTEQGQIIRAKVQDAGSILFADLSRGVDDEITKPPVPVISRSSS